MKINIAERDTLFINTNLVMLRRIPVVGSSENVCHAVHGDTNLGLLASRNWARVLACSLTGTVTAACYRRDVSQYTTPLPLI